MEGVLSKWVNYIFGWRERYFVLKGNVIYYYYKKGEKPKGKIHLAVSLLNQTNDPLKFEIDTGLNVIYIKATSKDVKDEWIRAIKVAKLEGENKLQGNIFSVNLNTNKECNRNDLEYNSNETNRNTVITEDKLLKKINMISRTVDILANDNSSMLTALNMSENNSIPEMKKIIKDNNLNVRNLQDQVRDLKKSFVSFNRDFIKLSEYFFNFKGAEQNYLNNHKNFVNDNNNIEYARAGAGLPYLEFDDNININIDLQNNNAGKIFEKEPLNSHHSNFLDTSSRIYQKDEDIFYAVSDNNDIDSPIENKNNNSSNKITENKRNVKLKIVEDETTPIKLSTELVSVEVENKFFDPMYIEKRKALPVPKKDLKLNVWSILKNAVGKDLSKFCVPGKLIDIIILVYFNEPLSMLQRLCENFQYADLLNRAAKEEDQFMRVCLMAAFCIGGYAVNIHRILKFFNPLLSETYEYVDNKMKFRYFSEQVSHHPAISACYAEGEGYTYYTNTNAESKFKIMNGSLEIHPIGKTYINLEKFNEIITFTKPRAVVKNLIMGKMFLDAYGLIEVKNNMTGDTCELELFDKSKDVQGKILGEAKDVYGNVKYKLEGNWLSHLDVIDPESGRRETIWKIVKIEGNEEERFYFSDYSINLNNLTEEMKSALPPSDSRFRPDQRYLEYQDYEKAASEKHRLEEKQRQTRKEREKTKFKYKPMYFEETYDDISGELIYLYKGGYWEDRKNKRFNKFYNIY